MVFQAVETADAAAFDGNSTPPCGFVAPAALRRLTKRSDRRGALQLGAHAGCMSATALLPAILAQPFLRALLIVEHTGCSRDRNGLSNTRTTLTLFPVRLLMWNMPYYAEHHLFPAVPFHRLPALHRQVRFRLANIAAGYRAANRLVVKSLW
jgi:fatty acid desaturase